MQRDITFLNTRRFREVRELAYTISVEHFLKTTAPVEARTLDLRISLSVLTYKYDALTDCATGADVLERV